MSGRGHVPVLLKEVLGALDVFRGGTYLDGTLGLAGHAVAILEASPKSKLLGFDRDETSLEAAKTQLAPYRNRVTLYHSDYRLIPELNLDLSRVKGVLLDMGLSSFQLDDPERGFSYNLDGPLDMRFDFRNKMTAAKVLEKYSEPKLAAVFKEHGELRQAKALARRIVAVRKLRRIERTIDLRRLVEEVCQWHPQKGKLHPAAKAFQALRIEVNQELEGLAEFLERLATALPAGCRLAVITFHSLEDRTVKLTFRRLAAPASGPAVLRLLTKKPIVPSDDEVAANSRSHSAKLRVAERI
jgi:16S rRNA (cytosine1402-N4)-methyltransferase